MDVGIVGGSGSGSGGRIIVGQHESVQEINVRATIEWSEGQDSPVTGMPMHPGRHDFDKKAADSSNRFALLADTDRRRHGLDSGEELVELVTLCLQGILGQHALKTAFTQCSRGALRIVLNLPKLAKKVGFVPLAFEDGEIVEGSGDAENAVLVMDVDEDGNLYIMTVYSSTDVPADRGRKAGDRDCYHCSADGTRDILFILVGDSIRPELIGGTTISGGTTTRR